MNKINKMNQIENLLSNIYNYVFVECSVDSLIDLKFIVEKQINMDFNNINNINNINKITKINTVNTVNISDNTDIYDIFTIYNNNIKLGEKEFAISQPELLKLIDVTLLVLCDHCWIDDVVDTAFSSYNIRYCSNCHIRKNVW